MSEHFDSLEAIGEQFKRGDNVETEAMFAKGAILVAAAKQGWDIDECAGYCASLTLRTKRTVYRYYSTVRTFPRRVYDLPYECHAIAADTIDYRKTMTDEELNTAQLNALEWLKRAKSEQWATRALRAAIKAAGGRVDVKPEVLLDGVECIFDNIARPIGNIELTPITLHIPRYFYEQLKNLPDGTEAQITLVKAPSVEREKQS